jgi:hypothetical protein
MNIDNTLNERGERYGEFSEFSVICQSLKDIIRNTKGWGKLTPSQKEALEMIMHKSARILNGDPNWVDSWHDISGYASLEEKRLNGIRTAETKPADSVDSSQEFLKPGRYQIVGNTWHPAHVFGKGTIVNLCSVKSNKEPWGHYFCTFENHIKNCTICDYVARVDLEAVHEG